jgi:hypothetical protein
MGASLDDVRHAPEDQEDGTEIEEDGVEHGFLPELCTES